MKKIKRILAMAGVVILAGMYAATLVLAVFATPAAMDLFRASLVATVVIPILLYAYMLIYRLISGKEEEIEESSLKKSGSSKEKISD